MGEREGRAADRVVVTVEEERFGVHGDDAEYWCLAIGLTDANVWGLAVPCERR